MTESVTSARSFAVQSNPADMYGSDDSEQFVLAPLGSVEPGELAAKLELRPDVVFLAAEADRTGWAQATARLMKERPELHDELRRVYANSYLADESPLHIVNVTVDRPVLSDRPFTVRVHYQNSSGLSVILASVGVGWAGEPFVVEHALNDKEQDGTVEVSFGKEQSLPVGPAEFEVTLLRADGAQSTFVRGVYVLPSNPLSLRVEPAGATVTGSWSVRGDYIAQSNTFRTECAVVVANGDAGAVSFNRRATWQFWNGGVGTGTLIESGTHDFPGPISVPAGGVWRSGIVFSSPAGSPIFKTYERKEDMNLFVSMTAADGRVVQGQITARVMLSFGVNIIKVGAFGAQEHTDLYNAVDRMRQIYEQRDMTLRGVERRIISTTQAGSYTTLNSEDEFRDLLEDWSVPNNFVDIYVVQDFQWSTFNGYAGAVPGPTSKGGRSDGVAVEKTGYTDASGTARLNVTTLAQLIGHEVGHYLGLSHQETSNNLMRSNTGVRGPDLDYNQYRIMFPHGFVFFE